MLIMEVIMKMIMIFFIDKIEDVVIIFDEVKGFEDMV